MFISRRKARKTEHILRYMLGFKLIYYLICSISQVNPALPEAYHQQEYYIYHKNPAFWLYNP